MGPRNELHFFATVRFRSQQHHLLTWSLLPQFVKKHPRNTLWTPLFTVKAKNAAQLPPHPAAPSLFPGVWFTRSTCRSHRLNLLSVLHSNTMKGCSYSAVPLAQQNKICPHCQLREAEKGAAWAFPLLVQLKHIPWDQTAELLPGHKGHFSHGKHS